MTQGSKHSGESGSAFETVWEDIKNIYSVRAEKRPWYTTKLTEANLQRWARQMPVIIGVGAVLAF